MLQAGVESGLPVPWVQKELPREVAAWLGREAEAGPRECPREVVAGCPAAWVEAEACQREEVEQKRWGVKVAQGQ